jgi:hypothetical protein
LQWPLGTKAKLFVSSGGWIQLSSSIPNEPLIRIKWLL